MATSNKPCEGCGKVFPNLESSAMICPKCEILEEHSTETEKYQEIQVNEHIFPLFFKDPTHVLFQRIGHSAQCVGNPFDT